MQVCRKCGTALRDTDKYCSQCGARAPSASVRARKEKAQKKKEQKEITFRTQPEKGTHYRENFEEGEKVKSVTIKAQSGLTGSAAYNAIDFENAKVTFTPGTESGTIELSYGNGIDIKADGTFEAYFVSFAAEQAHRLIHFVASPLKFRPAALGSEFVHSVPASRADLSGSNLLRVVQSLGSLSIRIMQTHLFYQQNCNYPFFCPLTFVSGT